jgi:hypothetical protein
MKFKIERVDETKLLIIRDEATLSGSICRDGDRWHVEITWSGPGGDIVYDAPSLPAAIAFVDGIGEALAVMDTLAKGKT